jgi:chromosome segregation ATPase
MEFSAFAEKETSALIARILSESSQSSRQRVEALRAALDSAAKAVEAAVAHTPDTHGQVAELVSQLTKAATAEADARLKRLSSEARKITDSLRADLEEKTTEKEGLEGSLRDALGQLEGALSELSDQTKARQELAGSLKEAHDQADALRAELNHFTHELNARTQEKDALAGALNEAHGRAHALGGELEAEARRAETLQRQLDAAYAEHHALGDALKNAEATREMDASARAGLESDLRAAHSLLESVQAEVSSARGSLETELRAAHNLIESVQAEAASAKAGFESELRSAHDLVETARAEAARAGDAREPELRATQQLLETAQGEMAHVKAELQAIAAEKGKVEHALSELTGHAQAAEAKLAATTTLFKTSSARVKVLEREREQHEDAMHALEARLEAAGTREVELEFAPATSAPAVALLDGLLGAFEAMAGAGTIGDVLSTLVEQLVNEFPRVALFRVKGNRLEGAHQIGFDLTNDIGKVMMPLAMDSLLTRAVSSGRTERVNGDRTDSSHLPFGGSPTCALAMPIIVDGEAMAVVYADDSGRAESQEANDDLNARFAEALRHHAVALLTRLTSELKAMAELRGYAGSLLSETEQMYEADVAAGKTGDDLLKRLHANLDYARSIYANRVASEPASTAGLLEAQLAGTIDLHRDNAFGRDLATVMVWESNVQPSRKAEAS